MSWTSLEATINAAWDERDSISPATQGDVRHAIVETLKALDCGEFRVAEKSGGAWHTHQWIKKAVLLSFRLNPMERIAGSPGNGHWWDKVPSKFATWSDADFTRAGFRAVPGAIAGAARDALHRVEPERQQHRLLDPLVRMPRPTRLLGHAEFAAIKCPQRLHDRMAHIALRGRRNGIPLIPRRVDGRLEACPVHGMLRIRTLARNPARSSVW